MAGRKRRKKKKGAKTEDMSKGFEIKGERGGGGGGGGGGWWGGGGGVVGGGGGGGGGVKKKTLNLAWAKRVEKKYTELITPKDTGEYERGAHKK